MCRKDSFQCGCCNSSVYDVSKGKVFAPGEGIVKDDVEKTVESIAKIAKEGMKITDEVVLKIMVD